MAVSSGDGESGMETGHLWLCVLAMVKVVWRLVTCGCGGESGMETDPS